MRKVTIYTDGGCRGNGSPINVGGYGAILMVDINGDIYKKEIKKGFINTTNNKMELQAVIDSIKLLKFPCDIDLYSDSRYVCDALQKGWLNSWYMKNWINSSKQPVKNKEMWQELHQLLTTHRITAHWVKGHAENEYNNRCDEMANEVMNILQ